MRCYQLIVLSVLAGAPLHNLAETFATPWDDIHVKHSWSALPPDWETLGHPPANTTIDLRVALKPRHENALIDALYEVSDPKSPKYGAHLSREQVAQLVAPHPDTLELIDSWVKHHGIPSSAVSTTLGGSWLTLTGVPVSQANELLGASYQLYRRTGTNDSTILRTIGYGLPAVLHAHVKTVVPTTYFSSARTLWQEPRRRSVEETAANSSSAVRELVSSRDFDITPSRLRWLYRTVAYVPIAMDRNKLGIAGYLREFPSPDDLTDFMAEYRSEGIDATFTVVKINNGKYDPSNPTAEASLNIEYAQGIAYPTPHIYYSTGGGMLFLRGSKKPAPGDALLEWLIYLLNQPNRDIPQTISTSFGVFEKSLPMEYTTTLCDMFAELGTRGVSLIFPSGNTGVGKGNCIVTDPDGTQSVQFIPEFPSSCPYVTSVGGTTSYPEFAASLSGGGFSNHFPRPPYQEADVPPFLKNLGTKYKGSYNANGRGIPDIAAQALKFSIIVRGHVVLVQGTSCAAPTVAGVISLLNDYLLSLGRDPLGFLNPWLYGKGRPGLNDIIFGSNPGCGTEGFSAVVGWDPVTGLGTPDFLNLQDALDRSFTTATTSYTSSAHATSNSATLPTLPTSAAP